jgi:shikimate dehydrogenase
MAGRTILGSTRLLAVIGNPIKHSLSPVMHNAAIAHLGVNYTYIPLEIASENFPTALAGLHSLANLEGFNVTIPHKISIIPYLEAITPVATQVGAVNTVWRTPTGWQGTNTDVAGFIAPLKALEGDWSQSRALILGLGGAARAVVVGLNSLGCKEIQVIGRDREKLEAFYHSWQDESIKGKISIYLWEEIPTLINQVKLIVNTTPIGMTPHREESPLDREILAQVKEGAIVYDLIYNPRPTRFLQLAQARGLTILDGLEMLVQQGAIALERWLKQPIPVALMRQALEESLLNQVMS